VGQTASEASARRGFSGEAVFSGMGRPSTMSPGFISGLPLLHTIVSISDRELGLFGFYQHLFLVRFLDEKGPDNFYIIDLLFYCYFTPSPEHIPRNFPKPLSHPFSFISFCYFLVFYCLSYPPNVCSKHRKRNVSPLKTTHAGTLQALQCFILCCICFSLFFIYSG